MRFLFIISIFLSSNFYGQTAINSFKLDATGHLHWNLNVKESDNITFSIQKKVSTNWVTIYNGGVTWGSIIAPNGEAFPSNPTPMKIIDSCLVPIDKETNSFRLILKTINAPSPVTSNEVSINRNMPFANTLTAKGDFIYLDDYYVCEIIDSNGTTVKTTDRANSINISTLNKGVYFINFGSDHIHIFEKK